MIELLILYSLSKRERTLYSLRADIHEKFGYFTRPSLGTIHPALKRLKMGNIVTVRETYSGGGKKSSYYGVAASWQKHFRELFFTPLSENPTLFFTEIQTKTAVLAVLEKEDREAFLKELILKLETFNLDLKNTLEDEYIELDGFQKMLLQKNIEDAEHYLEFVEKLKNACNN